MNDISIETKRQRIEMAVKVVALGAVGLFVGPFIFLAVKGLIGLLIAGGISLAAIHAAPAAGAALANWRLKLIKAEAARNPVETLQNDFRKRQEALGNFAEAIKKFISEKESFAAKLQGFKTQYPDEAPKFAMQLGKMDQLLTLRKQKYKQAQHSLELYEAEIQKAGAIWEMGQAAAQMTKAAGMTEDDFFAKISVETALDSVEKNMNAAFADLEVSLLDEGKAPGAIGTAFSSGALPPPETDSVEAASPPRKTVKTPIQ